MLFIGPPTLSFRWHEVTHGFLPFERARPGARPPLPTGLQIALATVRSPPYEPGVFWTVLLGLLAALSAALCLWQWGAALRFPLHRRLPECSNPPGVTLLKPLKGCDEFTRTCLRSWLETRHTGPCQVLFGVASPEDPVCDVVRALLAEFPNVDGSLVPCPESLGVNAKVSTLVQLCRQARHPVLVVSDADVAVPPDLLGQLLGSLNSESTGLVSCFYRLANPSTPAMRCEAVAVNADFWSQVLQSNTLKPMDFALGAVMAVRAEALHRIGGFEALANCLADDYQLGHRIAGQGCRVELSPAVVDCWDPPQGWKAVWIHQLRWARTIRVCQPLPYFFSILTNATLWALLWAVAAPSTIALASACLLVLLRCSLACHLQARMMGAPARWSWFWMVPVRDALGGMVWAGAFLGNTIEWRGRRLRLLRDGTLRALDG